MGKFGWQIENELHESNNKSEHSLCFLERELSDIQSTIKTKHDELPFVCLICKEPWKKFPNPVRTICGHYFHEICALKRNNENGRCFFCGEPTKGIFNTALEIINSLG